MPSPFDRRPAAFSGGLQRVPGVLLAAPGLVLAAPPTERRFVFVIQRGAADGLDTVVPYADPAYARLRGALAVDAAAAIRLDGTFALHPSLAEVAEPYTPHSKRCSCTLWHRPTEIARTSTARTCSNRVAPRPTR